VPIRARLTLAFAAAMAVVLAATGVFVYLRFQSELDASLDQGLRSRADEAAALLTGAATAKTQARIDRLAEQDESFTQVLGRGGRVVIGTPSVGTRRVLPSSQFAAARRGTVLLDRDPPRGLEGEVRVLARPVGGGRVIAVGASRDDQEEALSSLLTVLATGGVAALLLASLAGYGLASAALQPVEAMRRRAAEISRLDTGDRLPVPAAGDELTRLGETLNGMLERLEQALERERGFVASASHELRTPLALLKGELELALREGRSAAELRAAISSAMEESDRLVQLAEDLLVLARADEGRLPVRPEALPVAELLEAISRRFGHRAAEAGRMLVVDSPPGAAVQADRLRAEQALGNLLDNALRHGEGAISLGATVTADTVILHVRDEGPGFTPDLLDTAFDRFIRGDRARARGGTGLGLAIVHAVAAAHGGRAGASAVQDGADVWIELPRAVADRAPALTASS
jgi:heavy metal sensor kinase